MVAHVIRFAKPYEYLKSLIESKELGKLIRLDMKRLSEKPLWSWENWMMDEKKSGGVPIDLSIHDIDFVQSILGMPDKINSVYTKMSRNGNDCIEAQLVYDDVVVTTEGAWFNYKLPFEAGFTAIFEEGMLRLQNGKLTKNGVEVELEKELVSEDTGINIKADNANVAELQYFVNCVVNNKQPKKVMPESSRKSIELVEKIISNAIVID